MSLILKKSEGKSSTPIPAGTHQAVCYGVIDLGVQAPLNPAYKPAHKLLLMWELPDERIQLERDGKKLDLPRGCSREFAAKLGSDTKPTKTRTFLEGWRGRKFTEQELAGFDLKNLIGANCLLTITHATKGDKTYSNVESASPLMKGMAKKQPENPTIFFDLSEFSTADEVEWPTNLPEWVVEKIKKSEEYAGLLHGSTEEAPAAPSGGSTEEDDGSVPF